MLIFLLLQIYFSTIFWNFGDCAYLLVEPSFLLVEEDWPIGTNLPVSLCPKNVRILSGDDGRFFDVVKVNDTCSTLKLNMALDADKENADGIRGQSFSLVIGGPKKSRATLEIQIVDVNDNPPQFYNTPSTVEVSEGLEIGAEVLKVYTKDVDTGISGFSRFSVEGDNNFSLDKRTCGNGKCSTTLRLASPLDFESKPIHTFNITAKDGDPHSNRTHTVSHTVTVHVKNVQNKPPVFKTDFSSIYKVPKDSKIGDTLATVTASDGDYGSKSGIKYSMEENEYLTIDEKSGDVKLKSLPFPKEMVTVEITATEDDAVGMSSKEKMKFVENSEEIQDQKTEEEKPTSDGQLCEYPIYEGKIVQGSGVFESAVVIRTLVPTTEKIRLIGGSDSFELLVTGENQLELKIMNHERIANQNLDNAQLLVKSASGQCRVVLKSVPAPKKGVPAKKVLKFEKDIYEFEVVENQKPGFVGKVKVIPEVEATYELTGDGSEMFKISENGEIESLQTFDRELTPKYSLTVKAGTMARAQISIKVIDENDNSPKFEKEHYLINVDEGKSEKVKISATDEDEAGPNSEIVYSIEDVGSLPIDISEGVLFIGAIDREQSGPEVNLTIRASDKGKPARSSTVGVTIRVKDINDNPPIFSNSKYSIVLDANISPGGVIGQVSANDSDATSPNNYIRYSSQDPKFKVTDQGEIIFVGPEILNRDSYLEFNVTATDGGEPMNSAQATVMINEHKSVSMKNELTTQINSNDTSESLEIKWLNAGMVGYSYEIIRATAEGFEDSEVMKWINIDKKSGRIETLARIDPDKVKQIKLYISMRKGKREVPVELIINVVDTDEILPLYTKETVPRKLSTSESSSIGTTVGILPAQGVDENDGVKYSITGSNGKLSIDKFGRIRIEKPLDFEKGRKIKGFIFANSTKHFAKVPYELTIQDANDNRPIFKNNSNFFVSIDENSVLGTVVDLPYPLATDNDSGKFAQLRYSMTGDEGYFKIDEGNSTIRLVAPLDFETQRVHSLSVKCVDNGGKIPYHEVFASVTINVIDVNDNPPIIHNSDLSHLNIGEDSQPGTVVTVLLVTDADEGGKQAISIDSNSTMFRVDDELRLVVAAPLKGYAGQRLCSTVTATDIGMVPQRTAQLPYCVTVYPAKNTHHNPLVISPKQNSIHYFDENIVYDELLRVKVLEEEGEVANVTFKLDEMFKKDWQMFTIGRVNGSLRARQVFDFEKKTVHEIKILACRIENCTSTHLFISVNDRNDNCPMFPKQDVRLTVLENEKDRRQVGRIPAALDSDFHSDNTKVCYTTDSPLFFFNDPTLPILFTNSSFDREQKKQHQITITAYDCHLSCRDPHKPTNGTIVALIDVLDVNDNFPRFSEKMYHTTIVQGQISAGSHILTVSATDEDEEPEGLKYSIRGFVRSPSQTYPATESPIAIEKSTGEISANEVLKESSYSFTIVAVDSAGHEDTATVMISVVTYAQQTELVFDAPFELIIKNEKKIAENLSNATGLQTIVDKCRQNSNFTLMLVHFVDGDGQFVNVDRAVNLLMASSAESRSELRGVYGLREAFPPVPMPSKMPQILALSILVFFLVFILCLCIWCRQRNNYERKLRHISAQASTVHTVTLGRNGIKPNPAYGEIPIVRQPAPPPPPPVPGGVNLQSTEL